MLGSCWMTDYGTLAPLPRPGATAREVSSYHWPEPPSVIGTPCSVSTLRFAAHSFTEPVSRRNLPHIIVCVLWTVLSLVSDRCFHPFPLLLTTYSLCSCRISFIHCSVMLPQARELDWVNVWVIHFARMQSLACQVWNVYSYSEQEKMTQMR